MLPQPAKPWLKSITLLQLLHRGSNLLYHQSCTTKAAEYYTEAPKYYTSKATECYTHAASSYYTASPKYYSAQNPSTSPRFWMTTLRCPSSLHRGSQLLQHRITWVVHDYVCCLNLLHRDSKVLLCFSYYTEVPTYFTTKTGEYYAKRLNTTLSRATQPQRAAAEYFVAPNHYPMWTTCINWLLHRITSSQQLVNILVLYLEFCIIKSAIDYVLFCQVPVAIKY
jgi:hypothetical protein